MSKTTHIMHSNSSKHRRQLQNNDWCTEKVAFLFRAFTYFLRTAISFSMLLSFPLNAFLGMHFTAYLFPVAFSLARTTSENAPLEERKKKS